MPVCDECGGDEFTIENGFFVCDECHTQSQDVRDFVNDELFTPGRIVGVRSTVISEKTRAERQRRKQAKAELVRRHQLTTQEVVNTLLERWTARLVAAGAPKALPERTAQLWAFYLRRLRDEDCLSMRWPRDTQAYSVRGTLCLIWVALADCDPVYRLSDMARWVREGILSAFSPSNEFPEDVTYRWSTMSVNGHLTVHLMWIQLQMMRSVLRITSYPRPPLSAVLDRLLSELALPTQLARVVANVARGMPPLDDLRPEACAMALILVTLKILLGLDDVTEVRNSAVAATRNATEPNGPRWFVFAEWLQHFRECRDAVGSCHYPTLEATGGVDPCRRQHRRLFFDYFQRDAVFRLRYESDKHGPSVRLREFMLRSGQLFGRPDEAEKEADAAPADVGDLLRPMASRLARCSAAEHLLARGAQLRDARVDFLLDEAHVRSLAAKGVEVGVKRTAARRRVCCQRFGKRRPWVMQFVSDRADVSPDWPPPQPAADGGDDDGGGGGLCLYMPGTEVWVCPRNWSKKHMHRGVAARTWPSSFQPRVKVHMYDTEARRWPFIFRFLVEALAGVIELAPRDFIEFCCVVEKHVLEPPPRKPPPRHVRRPHKKRVFKRQRESDSDEEVDSADDWE
ncbi:uncharacterized protein LOC119105907 [Pollicipes pollicipes]|uniref:uncharacterized protein LOC119105907 n=1 Tax=Pollicipes pollicipes TaxID=41117 RepID=UPI001885960D|nr:uncharacterized protein LOC119105907 [Pollicipes pollicipes]